MKDNRRGLEHAHHRDTVPLNGSLEQRIIWDYSLSGETLDKISWKIQREEDNIDTRIGVKRSSGLVGIIDAGNIFENFNIISIDPATLIIHHHVTETDEAGDLKVSWTLPGTTATGSKFVRSYI